MKKEETYPGTYIGPISTLIEDAKKKKGVNNETD